MTLNLTYHEFKKGLHRLKEMDDVAFIVEGKHDKLALERFGIKNIFTYSSLSAQSVVNKISYNGFKKIVILTDFDDEGKDKEKELSQYARSIGIEVDKYTRKFVKRTFGVTQIEEFSYYSKKGYDEDF